MNVVYTAPNRGHHFKYATALHDAGCLHAFVSGYSRLSQHHSFPALPGKLHHADIIQTLYILSLKANFPKWISGWLGYQAKLEQDRSCKNYIDGSDIFLFYNGCGLNTGRHARGRGVTTIVEVVNSHVESQEAILREEYKSLKLPWTPFSRREKKRRIAEYNESDYILLPSEFVKRSFIEKGFDERRLIKVPYGFEKPVRIDFQLKKGSKKETFNVLYVGSISVRKGLRYLIEAFNKVNHPAKKLVIVGPDISDGSLNNVRINGNIHFTGPLKGDSLQKAYLDADVFCLPSIEEGLALVLGEALSYGIPVIATTNSGVDDIVGYDPRFVVPIKSSTAIQEKMQQLADMPELRRDIREKMYTLSDELGSWDKTSKLLVSKLREIHDK